MKRTPRVLAAVVAATALTFTGVHTADAKPDRAGSHAKAEKAAKAKGGKSALETKLARDVARKVAQLDNAVSEKRLAELGDADRGAVLLNVVADKTALATMGTRAELRGFRVENYRLVVNVLRKAAKLRAAAAEATEADTTAATALVDSAVAAALLVTAQTDKSGLKAARADLAAASALLDPEESDVDDTEGDDIDGDDSGESQLTEGGDDDATGTDTGEPVV